MSRLLRHPLFYFALVIRSLTKNNMIMEGAFILFIILAAVGILASEYVKRVE